MKAATNIVKRPVVIAAIALLFAVGFAHVAMTWPNNMIATAIYRLLGKAPPSKTQEDLRNVKLFLNAKRKIDSKQYAAARADLEKLSHKVETNFLFFREIFFYLGYVYDVTGEFRAEEALYSRLGKHDPTFSKFMFGLYHVRQGKAAQAQQELVEALKLDDRHRRLGKYRQTAVQALQTLNARASRPAQNR